MLMMMMMKEMLKISLTTDCEYTVGLFPQKDIEVIT